jgi:hypothetical protein
MAQKIFIMNESKLYCKQMPPEPTFNWCTSTLTKIEEIKDEKPKWAVFTKYKTKNITKLHNNINIIIALKTNKTVEDMMKFQLKLLN